MDSLVRPPGAAARSERIELRITVAGKKAIADLAAQEDRSFSDMVRVLLSRGVAATPKPRTITPAPKGGKA